MEEVVVTMGNVYQWELPAKKLKAEVELDELEKAIEGRTMKWKEIRELVGGQEWRRKALILLYAHLLRIPITKASLQKGETCRFIYDHP